MRDLVGKHPEGYEGWARARGEKIVTHPLDIGPTDVQSE